MEADLGDERRSIGDLKQGSDVGCPVLCSLGPPLMLVNLLQPDKSSSRNVDNPSLLYSLLAGVKIEQELSARLVLVPELFFF